MRAKHTVTGLATIAAAVLGLSLVTAGSASALETGSWRAFGNTNPITSSSSHWRCATSNDLAPNVVAQACAVRSADGDAAQGAVIVRNNESTSIIVDAAADLVDINNIELGDWVCANSGVAAHSWSVCFGQTVAGVTPVKSAGIANGVMLGTSPFV